jgi:hypothetical protein
MNKYTCLLLFAVILVLPALSLADIQGNITNNENKAKVPTEHDSTKQSSKARIFNETDRGKLLYENHCIFCHSQSVHDKSNTKVHSYKDIRHWVMHWSKHLKLEWNNDDLNTVTDYLNREFYHFPSKPLSPD